MTSLLKLFKRSSRKNSLLKEHNPNRLTQLSTTQQQCKNIESCNSYCYLNDNSNNNYNNNTTSSSKDFREEYQILKVLFIGNCRKAIQSIQQALPLPHNISLIGGEEVQCLTTRLSSPSPEKDSYCTSGKSSTSKENKKDSKRNDLCEKKEEVMYSPRSTIRINTNKVQAQKKIMEEVFISHKSELNHKELIEWKEQLEKIEEIANQIYLMEFQYNEETIKLMPDKSNSSFSCILINPTSLMVQADMIDTLDLTIGIQWFIRKYCALGVGLTDYLLHQVGLLEEEIERFELYKTLAQNITYL
ncbi:hypothetical protein ABK040_002457 [Willaertia magna]